MIYANITAILKQKHVRRVLDQSSASGYFIEVIACNEPYFIQRLSRSVAHVDIRSSPLETIRR